MDGKFIFVSTFRKLFHRVIVDPCEPRYGGCVLLPTTIGTVSIARAPDAALTGRINPRDGWPKPFKSICSSKFSRSVWSTPPKSRPISRYGTESRRATLRRVPCLASTRTPSFAPPPVQHVPKSPQQSPNSAHSSSQQQFGASASGSKMHIPHSPTHDRTISPAPQIDEGGSGNVGGAGGDCVGTKKGGGERLGTDTEIGGGIALPKIKGGGGGGALTFPSPPFPEP